MEVRTTHHRSVSDTSSNFFRERELSIDTIAKAFHDNNQLFLRTAAKATIGSPSVPSLDRYGGRSPLRSENPPVASSTGFSVGRAFLNTIQDTGSSVSSQSPRLSGGLHRRAASHGTVSSYRSGYTSISALSGPSPISLENKRMTSRPRRNDDIGRLEHRREISGSTAAADSLPSTMASQSTSIDSRVNGYSGDDNWSLPSTEFSYEQGQGANDGNGVKTPNGRTNKMAVEKKYFRKYLQELEEDRQTFMAKWREDYERKDNATVPQLTKRCADWIWKFLATLEVFICNMPLTIGAVGLSWVTQGVVWFKFMEENVTFCTPVHYYSPHCIYPEFPGCFECDQSNTYYRVVVSFHYLCNFVGFTCCLIFAAKCILAWRVVADDLSNPATSTPCGVVCITMICVAAGRGLVGEVAVFVVSVFHILLSFWFLYIAIYRFGLWPDPGWFPNTVGIAYAAVKSWLYFPIMGIAIMGLCVVYFVIIFPIAIYRAYSNHKIAAPVCFISLSAPSITLYAMTIMAQSLPSQEQRLENDPGYATEWRLLHREFYLPIQHGMMILSLIGFASSLHCLWTRWPVFHTKPFSPAHMAFVFPILSHTNAVQAYRSGWIAFSKDHMATSTVLGGTMLYSYWVLCLLVGTVLNLIFTYKFVSRLYEWTKLDAHFQMDNEEIPPSPNHTLVHSLLLLSEPAQGEEEEEDENEEDVESQQQQHQQGHVTKRRYTDVPREIVWNAPVVNAAVLQANEAGTLVRVRRGTEDYEHYGPYVRTRNVTALGFDVTMTNDELGKERAEFLDWVSSSRALPRRHNRTWSVPATYSSLWLLQRPDPEDHAGRTTAAEVGTNTNYGSIDPQEIGGQRERRGHRPSLTWAGQGL